MRNLRSYYSAPIATFFRYMKRLREQTGLMKPPRRGAIRDETEPGYEGQVDFGQYVMKSMYGNNVRVYFFCMVLSYSRMKFAYFSAENRSTPKKQSPHISMLSVILAAALRCLFTIRTKSLSSPKIWATSFLSRNSRTTSRRPASAFIFVTDRSLSEWDNMGVDSTPYPPSVKGFSWMHN